MKNGKLKNIKLKTTQLAKTADGQQKDDGWSAQRETQINRDKRKGDEEKYNTNADDYNQQRYIRA